MQPAGVGSPAADRIRQDNHRAFAVLGVGLLGGLGILRWLGKAGRMG